MFLLSIASFVALIALQIIRNEVNARIDQRNSMVAFFDKPVSHTTHDSAFNLQVCNLHMFCLVMLKFCFANFAHSTVFTHTHWLLFLALYQQQCIAQCTQLHTQMKKCDDHIVASTSFHDKVRCALPQGRVQCVALFVDMRGTRRRW